MHAGYRPPNCVYKHNNLDRYISFSRCFPFYHALSPSYIDQTKMKKKKKKKKKKKDIEKSVNPNDD